MRELNQETPVGPVQGSYAAEFEHVADAFVRNFAEHGEVGASVCVTLDGAPVVDLWGGTKNQEEETPWQEDTMCVVFSRLEMTPSCSPSPPPSLTNNAHLPS